MYEVKKNENYTFDAEKTTKALIQWVRDWFAEAGSNTKVILGMSGGKDSTVAAAVMAEALGKDRVIGVSMPDKNQSINEADKICEHLGIKYICAPIEDISAGFAVMESKYGEEFKWGKDTRTNIPPRIRMTMLYALGQTYGCRVLNTCNLSEDYVGYATKFGDGAGDFSVFANLTVTEVRAIGDYLGVPSQWVHKIPDDGLPCSCPDEDKFGFTYAELDIYLRTGKAPEGHCHDNPEEPTKIEKIERMHRANVHKLLPMPAFTF